MASSSVSLDSDPSDSCRERQRDEVEAMRSIFAADFIDLRTDKSNQPAMYEITIRPTNGPSGRQAHAKVILCIQYKADYPKSVPLIDVKNDKGISLEQIKLLKQILQQKAEEYVGEEMVYKLTVCTQDYLEAFNFEKPLSFYDEMLKNQQKQEADKATSEKKKKDIILMQEKKKNKKVEDEVKQRYEAIRKKQKEDDSSDEEGDICRASSVEPVFSSSESQSPLNDRDKNIPIIKVDDNQSTKEDDMKSGSDFPFHKPKSSRIRRDFEVIAQLGKGAFGYVMKVKNKVDDRVYAIKIIDSKNNDKLFKNITTEVKLLSRLNHENIVRYYNSWIEEYGSSSDDDDDEDDDEEDGDDEAKCLQECEEDFSYSLSDYVVFEGSDDDEEEDEDDDDSVDDDLVTDSISETRKPVPKRFLFIQMEYCEKSTLKTCIENDLYKEIDRVWRLFRELLDALAHIHEQGIIHRDLKPGNIFLDSYDHIKIGDFGLATIRKAKPQQTVNEPDYHPELFQSEECLTSTLTTEIGTFFYMSPEMNTPTGHYDQQIDMYSLGIIFFEMCYTRMETKMERFKVLTNLRRPDVVFPDNFEVELENQKQIIQSLLNHESKSRPTSKELLQSRLLPPVEIEEAKIKDVLASAISNPKSKTYKYIVESFFNQKYDDVCDTIYDKEVFKPCHVRYSLLQQNIIDSVTQIFTRHGAIRISTPLLMPRNKIHSTINPTFMDQNGQLVCLPDNHKVPLVRYVKRKNINNLKRYNIDRMFFGKTYGLHPKEFIKCSFDIITPTTCNFLPDSEIIYLIEEIINEFSRLKARNFSVVMNHTSIIKALLIYCGISKNNHEEILHLIEKRGEKTKHLPEALERLGVSEQKRGLFIKSLRQEGKLDEIKTQLSFLTKCKGEVSSNFKQGIKELTEILTHCEYLEIKLPIRIKLGFLRHVNQHSGMFFEVNSISKKQTIDILAIGGRFDKLMSDYSVALYRNENHQVSSPCAVGVSISMDQIVSMLNKENEDIKRCDFMVCAYPDNSSSKSLLKKVHSLWSKKKSAMLAYDTVQQLSKIEKQCKIEGIRNIIIIKNPLHSKEMVIDDTNKLKKKPYKIENTDQSFEKDTRSRNHGASFKLTFFLINRNTNKKALENKGQSSYDILYVIYDENGFRECINFNDESNVINELNSNLKWIPSNSAKVNVLVVDFSVITVKEFAARINLKNEKKFNESVCSIESIFSKAQRKFFPDLCEKIREIRFDNGSCNIVLYTIEDDFFKIL